MKNQLSITECARLAGVSRQTIYKKVSTGKLTKLNNKLIDLSELLRIYPHLSLDNKDFQGVKKSDKPDLSSSANPLQDEVDKYIKIAELTAENKYLNQRIEDLQKTVNDLQKDKDYLFELHKRQTLLLTDESNQSWLSKIFKKQPKSD